MMTSELPPKVQDDTIQRSVAEDAYKTKRVEVNSDTPSSTIDQVEKAAVESPGQREVEDTGVTDEKQLQQTPLSSKHQATAGTPASPVPELVGTKPAVESLGTDSDELVKDEKPVGPSSSSSSSLLVVDDLLLGAGHSFQALRRPTHDDSSTATSVSTSTSSSSSRTIVTEALSIADSSSESDSVLPLIRLDGGGSDNGHDNDDD